MQTKPTPEWLTLSGLPLPVKALVTCVILTLALGMLGALGQIYVHDIVPTFIDIAEETPDMEKQSEMEKGGHAEKGASIPGRGDLFADLAETKISPKDEPIYKSGQFVWTLKWSHIHLFSMNMIFILVGVITLMLDVSSRSRTWLVVLPFIGVLLDIVAMWLKGFVSPVFFWLHIPGGGLFGIVFGYVSVRALWEMWGNPAGAS